MFGLLFEQECPADQFRFGRETDGTPAAPWDWEDLDLRLVPRPRERAVWKRSSRDAGQSELPSVLSGATQTPGNRRLAVQQFCRQITAEPPGGISWRGAMRAHHPVALRNLRARDDAWARWTWRTWRRTGGCGST
jgi:hypothetical protein